MATAMKAALPPSTSTSIYMKAALFHSSPVLDRKRRTHWDSGGGAYRDSPKKHYNHARRFRKMHDKHTLLRNVSAYAEQLFKSWRDADHDDYYDNTSSSKGTSWFRRQFWPDGTRRSGSGSQAPRWETYRKGFQFSHGGDEDVESIFRSAVGGARFTYWSFIDEEDFSQPRSSSNYTNNHKSSRNWRYKHGCDYDTYEEYDDDSTSDFASDRVALGLSASGPLKLEDVKSAYRACALKWHPDRHQGSSKAVAEEKFKLCSAAYQSLCDKLD